ncbi:heterokaryon incompatibility protein [Colletotrichum musicola]|uniref:Heterokaryon incompatibility protein n=1 Tax=Colletotrichum musicola TaxID=2175873 RepID=A0A8H6KIY7_9PEZI|nr:heterokaryon incompatibility protein [Colletotrichum musicola]
MARLFINSRIQLVRWYFSKSLHLGIKDDPIWTSLMGTYKYSLLPDGRYFRLLRVVQVPADGARADSDTATGSGATATASSTSAGSFSESDRRLLVELTTFPIDHAPPYWALSYTWGPALRGPDGEEPDPTAPQPRMTISCGGAPMQIGENLHDFLSLCRDKGFPVPGPKPPPGSLNWREGHAAYLWIDALCINQESLDERAQQVRLMAAIYKVSKRVLVWFGRHTLSPESAWAYEIVVPSLVRAVMKDYKSLTGSTFELDDPKVIAAAGEEEVARWRAAYPGLFNFFVRARWFGCGWIVQEVLLKENLDDVTILCG